MERFLAFMEGPGGRALRVVLGLALIVLGLGWVGGKGGWVLGVAGLLPVLMGGWGPCLVGIIHRRRRGTDAETMVDPVCGMSVPANGRIRATHAGQTYVFCGASCLQRFQDTPLGYVGLGGQRALRM